MLLGCIADDFTGASDLANMLTVAGMKTVQIIGVPQDGATAEPIAADAVVVALKSRSVAVGEAVDQSLAALAWLRAAGARQYLFKYCSTFDSTPEGNIGPVAEALMAVLDTDFTIACPAFPANRRTVFQGHLFVGDRLLSESGMEHHPVTPMTDPDLVRWLQRQCRGKVGLVDNATVDAGPEAIDARFTELAGLGVKVAICDATSDRHLRALGKAAERLALITGGSGIALGLPDNFRASGALQAADANVAAAGGRAIVLSGSCSTTSSAVTSRAGACDR